MWNTLDLIAAQYATKLRRLNKLIQIENKKTPLNQYQQEAIIEIVEKHKAELLLNMNRMIDDIAENMKAELLDKMQTLTVYG